jgi:hypothetical protein
MISHVLIKEPTNFYIKYSVVVDLDTLEIVQQKLFQYDYNKIEYKFSIRNTNYTCNKVSEMRTIFSDEGISEIRKLDITCRNNECSTIFIEFRNSSDYYLKIYSSEAEPRDLMKAILLIIKEQNIQGCNLLTKIIGESENIAWMLLILLLLLCQTISNQSTFNNFLIAIVFLAVCIILSQKQEVKIILKKASPFTLNWILTFKDFIVGICASLFAAFIFNA